MCASVESWCSGDKDHINDENIRGIFSHDKRFLLYHAHHDPIPRPRT